MITSPRVGLLLRELNALLDQQAFVDLYLCAENARVTCAPNPRDSLQHPRDYRDGVHLNDDGHRLIAASLSVPEPASGTLPFMGLALLGRRRSRPAWGWGSAWIAIQGESNG